MLEESGECGTGRMDLDDDYSDDDDYSYYNWEAETDDEEEEEDRDGGSSQGNYCGFSPFFLTRNYAPPPQTCLTQEEADRNAKQLVEEEEREKEKANKKRLRKKRQKDRRRQQKLQEVQAAAPEETQGTSPATTDQNGAGREEPAQPDSVSASEDDLDLGSSFVRKAQKKMANKPKPERRERSKETSRDRVQERLAPPLAPPMAPPLAPPLPGLQGKAIKMNILDHYKTQESLDLASLGNSLAQREKFSDSLHFYTEALKINPCEYRFLGNRSYSYERLGQYEAALADADEALRLRPDFLKGFFRKGKALKGLKRYPEAVAAFRQVLACDKDHVEAAEEIAQCQQRLQTSMSGTRVKILSNAPLSPPAAPPPVSAPGQNQRVFVSRNIYNTKSGAADNPPLAVIPPTGAARSKLFPIWVGNVTNSITEDVLRTIFQPFGPLHSVRMLHSRTCAFVNFTSKDAAESAFRLLQGLNVGGTTLALQLRNPEHNAGARK